MLAADRIPSAKDIVGSTPLIAVENEAPAKLIVDPPLPEPLSQGRVFIQYRTENLRILPMFRQKWSSITPKTMKTLLRRSRYFFALSIRLLVNFPLRASAGFHC
ncbi:DUF6130 family protein [Tolypothrix bouteillei VB521301_2]|uniref:DUF6130 family protein n=1 Tax=Tolypothrix bouteillei TaxID=1246981 RepID=UPI0038B5C752